MRRIVTAAEMRELDRLAIETFGIPGAVLMENAGRAAAAEILALPDEWRRAGVVCGGGNNGGDGFVVARCLHDQGRDVSLFLARDPSTLTGDARLNHTIAVRCGVPVIPAWDPARLRSARRRLAGCDLLIDALLGTGLSEPVHGPTAVLIGVINAHGAPVVSLDLPSGLSADTGQPLGVCVRAAATVTFGFVKRGCVVAPGAHLCGCLTVADIGIPAACGPAPSGAPAWLLGEMDGREWFGPRPPDAHKGHFGHVAVAAGSTHTPGAARLCAAAALRCGAGLVTVVSDADVCQLAIAGRPELMAFPFGGEFDGIDSAIGFVAGRDALAFGPGFGLGDDRARLLGQVLSELPDLPLVVDADGLSLLAGDRLLRRALARRNVPAVLTPHPGEMARLCGCPAGAVTSDPFGAARSFARAHVCVVVLKGSRTVIAAPEGSLWVSSAGNPGMATGGSGDVLTGAVAALLARGLPPAGAACGGVLLHGLAGDLAREGRGEAGLIAGDLIECMPEVLRRWERREP